MGADIEAEMHIRAWALTEKAIISHFEKIDQQRRAYLQQCCTELGMEPMLAQDVAMIAYTNFLGMQQLYPKPSLEKAKRLGELSFNKFVKEL